MVNFKILHPLMLEKEVVADLLAGFDEPGFGPGPHRGEGMRRNNPNERPREGDWICTNPLCGTLNFSSGEFCHNCKRPRYRSGGSPRRGYPGPQPPHAPPRRFPGPSLDLSPSWTINGYRSPPQGGGDSFFHERKGFERQPPSPPLPQPSLPQRGSRNRSRSPIRGVPLPKEFCQDMYMERGRDVRHPVGRGRMRYVY